MTHFIYPAWKAPRTITALTSTRTGGVSQAPFHSYNLGDHAGDVFEHVQDNRRHLSQILNLPSSPCWLNQTHSNQVVLVDQNDDRSADAAISRKPGQVLAIMTADCMPLLICNRDGNEIAAIHAGWRGLANGIIENTIFQMNAQPHDLLVWIGPTICEACFEVGDDVKSIFISQYDFAKDAFIPTHAKDENKWLGSMVFIAKKICTQLGIHQNNIFESRHCTMEERGLFYSYRRDGVTGRMASLIWFTM